MEINTSLGGGLINARFRRKVVIQQGANGCFSIRHRSQPASPNLALHRDLPHGRWLQRSSPERRERQVGRVPQDRHPAQARPEAHQNPSGPVISESYRELGYDLADAHEWVVGARLHVSFILSSGTSG
jgi:hypothetical protein